MNATVDSLVFEVDLLIQREVVLDVHLHLVAPPGTELGVDHPGPVDPAWPRPSAGATSPRSSPTPRSWPPTRPPRQLASWARRRRPGTAALAPRLAAELYGLEVLARERGGPPGQPDPVRGSGPDGLPAPTGHDKTSIVCFQREDRPGSLHGILSEFAARSINLTKLESRPTKRGLGDYCFLIDLEGHLADEVVADCLRVLHAELAGVKFLGSYPAAGRPRPRRARPGRHGVAGGRRLGSTSLRSQIRPDPERRYPGALGRDGRADECEALEKPWPKRLVGSNPTPSAGQKGYVRQAINSLKCSVHD